MFPHHLQHLKILLKCLKAARFNEIFSTIFLKVLNICIQKYFKKLKW